VTHEVILCGPGPAVVCTWSMDVESHEVSVPVLRAQVVSHLSGSKGWPADLSESRCRTWGWITKEHVCLTVEVREVVLDMPSLTGGFRSIYRYDRLTVLIAYW
jgi:hypothetical protein